MPAGLLLCCLSSAPAQTPYRIGSPGNWVKVHAPDLTVPAVRSQGWEYVLTDRQESVGPSGVERYWHAAYRVLDQAAVTDNSQIQVDFDPTYQSLTLHAVTVWRGRRALNQLVASRIHVAQREPDLEDRVFNGALTVAVVLEDVRPGDIIEYSYTRSGINPVFRGHYMAAYEFQSNAPVAEQHARLVWRRDRPVYMHALGNPPAPVVSTHGDSREYEWSRRSVPAVTQESDVPNWFVSHGTIQFSDFASWPAVAAWGDSLFADAPLPAEVHTVVERIRSTAASPEERILQALRWVQDEIRYTGIEIGINSHQPYSPAVVFKRRYGDCKDKALLLITMLRALGFTARPALVSTDYGGHVGDYEPTAALFDHAIVQVVLDGKDYWLDPTDTDQRGGIADVAAYYGAALPLGAGAAVDSLVTMPDLRPPTPTTDIVMSFDVGDVGEPTTMIAATEYAGRTANSVRSTLRASSREELQRTYVDYYAKLYPSIRSEQLPEIQDDEKTNVLRVSERYTIPEFWTGDSVNGRTGRFEPIELSNLVPEASGVDRHMPLAVGHPVHVRYVINAHFNRGWSIRTRRENIVTPAVKFTYATSVDHDVLKLSYEYETLSDHVLPEAAAEHIKDIDRVRNLLVFRVTPPKGQGARGGGGGGGGPLNWSALLAALFAATIACMGALRASRAQLALPRGSGQVATGGEPSTIFPSAIPRDDLVGLGGWLILVGIGIVVSPVRILSTLSTTWQTVDGAAWGQLTNPGTTSYDPLWAPGLMFELIANVGLFVFSCLLVYLFFKKKRQFPVVFICVVLASIAVNIVDVAFQHALPIDDPASINGKLVSSGVLWMVYMIRSRRVRNTFVN